MSALPEIEPAVAQLNEGEPARISDDKRQDHEQIEEVAIDSSDLQYKEADEEPEFSLRTWIALAVMVFLNMTIILALQGPPVSLIFIGRSLHDTKHQSWVPNSLSLVQAVLGPVISSASDIFQARKSLLVGCCIISFIGSAIAPGSQSIGRLIAAQTLIGVGFGVIPLAYAVPSEITPRRWRPVVQGVMNFSANCGAIIGPLTIGALTRNDPVNGWRNFWWFEMALWGTCAVGIFLGYRPPTRHTRLDHLSFSRKLGQLDLLGSCLLTISLTLFLVSLNLGDIYSWIDARTLTTLLGGIAALVGFAVYEWKGTKTGILHHELFCGGNGKGQTFALCLELIFVEGIMLFSYVVFFPQLTGNLYEHDAFLLVARMMPWQAMNCFATLGWGYLSTHFRTIREPLFLGFLLLTAAMVGFATLEPANGLSSMMFAGLGGFGFGAPLILIVSGVQLSIPHHLIATATAVTTSSRAISAAVFTAIYYAVLSDQLATHVPHDVGKAATRAGLPSQSVPAFISAITENNQTAIHLIDGVTPAIMGAGRSAYLQAYADSIRVIWIIAATFGVVACLMCLFVGDFRKTMNYVVDAPVEQLHVRRRRRSLNAHEAQKRR